MSVSAVPKTTWSGRTSAALAPFSSNHRARKSPPSDAVAGRVTGTAHRHSQALRETRTRWEEFRDARDTKLGMEKERQDLLDYESRLNDARDRIGKDWIAENALYDLVPTSIGRSPTRSAAGSPAISRIRTRQRIKTAHLHRRRQSFARIRQWLAESRLVRLLNRRLS